MVSYGDNENEVSMINVNFLEAFVLFQVFMRVLPLNTLAYQKS